MIPRSNREDFVPYILDNNNYLDGLDGNPDITNISPTYLSTAIHSIKRKRSNNYRIKCSEEHAALV